MTELDKTKKQAVEVLRNLCAKCRDEVAHDCPVRRVISEIEILHGIPVIVNERLRHVVFN